jgi:His-Xaa-Ser system protein HxsD
MRGIEARDVQPFVLGVESSVALEIDTSIYAAAAVLRACYKFTDRCYFFVSRCPEAHGQLAVHISAKEGSANLNRLVGDFCNELLDQQIRESLAREAGAIREIIVSQAFAEGNLLDPLRDEGKYQEDPLGIGEHR